ncbi:tumor susceptibility gene 101 protein-like isoform X2 [Oppia nitens]|uniref:tumor susceptibility gene 101 protein-like isoform X2 n=1 Tax=Oppia nitens TaxID=1686743 RepID=UPI0023DC3DEE|nr:tumor susceptibility gene 101 protein-like isoform X2 [Oppia nitens]
MSMSEVVRLLTNAKYRYVDQSKRDVMSAINMYKNLSPKGEKYVFPNGNQRDLVCLTGTIPVPYRGAVYNIPVSIWLTESHPYDAPICYVKPTKDMTIKVSKHVDQSGRIYLPYLSDWKSNTSDLLGVIQVMICVFGETPPVYSKPKNVGQTGEPSFVGQTSTGYQPMPRIPNPTGMPTTSTPYPAQYQPHTQYPFTTPPYPTATGPQPYIPSTTSNTPYPPYSQSYTTPTQSQQLSPGGTGTITEEHIRVSLISAIEDAVKQRVKEKMAQNQAEMDVLKKTSEELTKGKHRLEDIMRRMEDEMIEINDSKQELSTKNAQLLEVMAKCDDKEKNIDIDEVFGPTQPLYKQLLNSFAEENAIVDAIYYLSEALRKGVIDLELFLKHVRELSRRQFMLRALMRVCREKAGLPV